jgi:hypothetical protein
VPGPPLLTLALHVTRSTAGEQPGALDQSVYIPGGEEVCESRSLLGAGMKAIQLLMEVDSGAVSNCEGPDVMEGGRCGVEAERTDGGRRKGKGLTNETRRRRLNLDGETKARLG